MKLRFFSLLAVCLATFSSGMASADGGGHKQVMPDENIIGISLLASIVAYFMISKVSKFSLNNEDKIAFSLVIFTIVVHAILGIDDLILLAGAAGFLAFGVAFFVIFSVYMPMILLAESGKQSTQEHNQLKEKVLALQFLSFAQLLYIFC